MNLWLTSNVDKLQVAKAKNKISERLLSATIFNRIGHFAITFAIQICELIILAFRIIFSDLESFYFTDSETIFKNKTFNCREHSVNIEARTEFPEKT